MPPDAKPGLPPIVPQPKTKAQSFAECLRALSCYGSDAISSPTSDASPPGERPGFAAEHVMMEQVGKSFVERNNHAIIHEIESEAHRREANHVEGTSNPPTRLHHISTHSGRRRLLELIVATIVTTASKMVKEPD